MSISLVIDDVETEEGYRRRGFVQKLMQRIVRDAAVSGATESILSASPVGKPLYQKLDYAEHEIILVLTKHKKVFAQQKNQISGSLRQPAGIMRAS